MKEKYLNRFLNFIKPFVKWLGNIHMPFSRKKITGEFYYRNRDKIEIGTVLLTKTNGEFSNLINPTKIKHAGIYVGKIDGICCVLEAVGKGVVLTDLVTFLTTKDVVVGCKPKFIRNELDFKMEILYFVNTVLGKPYDYIFTKGNKAYYCFELAAESLKYVYPELQFKCKDILKGKKIYNENTFLDTKVFEVIFDSRKGK